MSDLDARVAALMALADTYYTTNTLSGFDFRAALRAELQKPALHEPVTDAEIESAIHQFLYVDGRQPTQPAMRRTLESFLQGRAKPASRIPFAGYDPNFVPGSDPNNPQEEQPAQEEITDAELKRIWLGCSSIDNESFCIEFARKIIRASKGEKT